MRGGTNGTGGRIVGLAIQMRLHGTGEGGDDQGDGAAGSSARVRLVSASISGHALTHRLEFADGTTLGDGLVDALARWAAGFVDGLPEGGPHRIGHPTLTVTAPGLLLSDLDAYVASPDAHGCRRLILSFSHYIGGVQNAFAAKTYFDHPTLSLREALGVQALADVVTPLLDIAAMAGAGLPRDDNAVRQLQRRLAHVAERAAELEYQAALLRRYVDACEPDRVRFADRCEAKLRGDDPDTLRPAL